MNCSANVPGKDRKHARSQGYHAAFVAIHLDTHHLGILQRCESSRRVSTAPVRLLRRRFTTAPNGPSLGPVTRACPTSAYAAARRAARPTPSIVHTTKHGALAPSLATLLPTAPRGTSPLRGTASHVAGAVSPHAGSTALRSARWPRRRPGLLRPRSPRPLRTSQERPRR